MGSTRVVSSIAPPFSKMKFFSPQRFLFARELIHRGLSSAAVILSLNAAFRWVKWDFDVL